MTAALIHQLLGTSWMPHWLAFWCILLGPLLRC